MLLMFPLYSAQAALVFNIGYKFNGDGTMYGPAPWLKVQFDDISVNTVQLTISAIGLLNGEKVDNLYLNLDPALNPTQLVFSNMVKTGTFEDPNISKGTNCYKADGDGYYDILIAFDQDGLTKAFNGGESVKYTITLASLTANSFDFVSAPGGGMGEYKIATHILAPGGVTSQSVWATIPEPATIALLGLGILTLVRKRKA
jgi:hypothetical protein